MDSGANNALMLVLHGSPRPEANEPAYLLAEELRKQRLFSRVLVAFMECNEPSIAAAIDECALQGIVKITALPWFLHAGRHLVLDIPHMLINAASRYPHLQILITDPIGTSPAIANVLAERAASALPLEG